MTSTVKIGLISLGVIGAGLGVFFMSRGGGKSDGPSAGPSASNTKSTSEAAGGSTTSGSPPTPSPAEESPKATGPQSAHVASPAPPLGLREGLDEEDRTWRPRPVETSVAGPPPVSPSAGQDRPAGDADTAAAPGTGPSDGALTRRSETRVESLDHSPRAAIERTITAAPPDAGPITLEPTTRPSGTAAQPGPAEAPPARPAEPAPKMAVHVVVSGDNFSTLAAKYLGSAKYANLIAKANPDVKPTRMLVGTKLNIPPAPAPTVAAAQPKPGTAPANGARPPADASKSYTVKPNDKWETLARKYLGDPNAWTVIYEHNKERFPPRSWTLKPGMVLEIPPKPAAPTTTTPKKQT
ncbi:MAG: LysM peptidoglycan-binding domain-containing protein [Phycisphaerae bacterium]|jgi:nucleoid-associated protein YgaU